MEYKTGLAGRAITPISWRSALHTHHDHRADEGLAARFPSEVICDACNRADGAAKRRFKLPPWFSFAPREILYFVRPVMNGLHVIDFDRAFEVWKAVGPALTAEYEQMTAGRREQGGGSASPCDPLGDI